MKDKIVGEITQEELLKLWSEKAVYAYDANLKVDWQINVDSDQRVPKEILEECYKNDCIIFTDAY